MTPYRHSYTIEDNEVDCFGYLKPYMILFYAQDVAGQHCKLLELSHDFMAEKRLFWAVIRHRVQISRMPRRDEKITVETWPMPTTRVAYPRAAVGYDENGEELFRVISLWVLMDLDTRAMVLPGKSGVDVSGLLVGTELAPPASLLPKVLERTEHRKVRYTDLDRNGHMNNCRYLEWVTDLLPSLFHNEHKMKEFTVCYLSEARESEELTLNWQCDSEGVLRVEATRDQDGASAGHSRVFAAQIQY